jgi:CubicO group peptidase (beta-lactamase class C family)
MPRATWCAASIMVAVSVGISTIRGQDVIATCHPPEAAYQCLAISDSIQAAVKNQSAPGITAAVVATRAMGDSKRRIEYYSGVGAFNYDTNPRSAQVSADDTQYDMASCSKIMATTTAAAQLYQRGYLGLEWKISDETLLGPDFASQGKQDITVENLLLHNAGFPPDPNPGYSSPLFSCPQTRNYHPGLDFSCYDAIFNNLLFNQTIVTPPGAVYVYSDLSMITLMYAIGKIVRTHASVLLPAADHATGGSARTYKMPPLCYNQPDSNLICFYYAYVKFNVFDRYGLHNTDFIPTNPLRTPPQWQDPWYHHGLIAGYVSDQNAYALGGIAGHAGVFSTARDAAAFMNVWMTSSDAEFLNASTIKKFVTVANTSQSSRALGWDTNAINLDPGPAQLPECGNMSPQTFLHIGYTGTQFCGDPVSGVFTVLLANGRYPNYLVDGMIEYRPVFGDLVQSVVVNDG